MHSFKEDAHRILTLRAPDQYKIFFKVNYKDMDLVIAVLIGSELSSLINFYFVGVFNIDYGPLPYRQGSFTPFQPQLRHQDIKDIQEVFISNI